MNKIKQTLFRIFFATEIVLFLHMYVFGVNGLCDVWNLEAESIHIQQEVMKISQEITALEQEANKWYEYSFFKEKCAREQLHMARADEHVYYL